MTGSIPRITLAPGLDIARLVVGLWQVADIERSGSLIDPDKGAESLAPMHRPVSTPLTWPIIMDLPRISPDACLSGSSRGAFQP